jgi:hypothetical protein
MMSRVGKIARLPREIREELNRRMDDGEPGSVVLPWLEGSPAVKQVMARHFGAAAVTKQNLSQWRQGGFAEWQAQRDLVGKTRELSNDAGELAGMVDGDITDRLATVVAAHYAGALAGWDGESNEAFRARLKVLKELCRPIVALRRGDHHMARLKFEKERLDFARERFVEESERGHSCPQQALGFEWEKSEQFDQTAASSPRPSPPEVCGGEGDRSAHTNVGVREISAALPVPRSATGQAATDGEPQRSAGGLGLPLPSRRGSRGSGRGGAYIVHRSMTWVTKRFTPGNRLTRSSPPLPPPSPRLPPPLKLRRTSRRASVPLLHKFVEEREIGARIRALGHRK